LIGNLFERFDDLKKGYVVDGDYFHGLCGCSPSEMKEVHAIVLAKRYDKLWPPFEMGEMIFGGKMGMKVDSALAFSVWKGGAEAGFRKCAEKVSWALHDGIGVAMNQEEASKWDNMALQMGDSLVMLYSMPSTGSSILSSMLGSIRGFSCADDPYGSSRGKRAAAYSEWVAVGCIQEMIDQKRSFRHPAGTVKQEFEEVMLIAPALKVAVLRRRNRLRGAVLEEMRKAIASWAREDGGETGPSVILDIEVIKARMDAATALEIEADKFLAAKYKDGTAVSFYYEDLFGDGKTIPERYAEFLRLLKFMEAPKPDSESETRLMTMLDVVPDGSWDTFEMVSNIHDIEDRLGSDEGGWVFGSMNMNDCHLQLMRRYFQMEGDRCRFGVGRERNDKLAVEFWIRGMHIGSVRCITNLGWAYKEGFGVEQDFVKAVELWEKGAAENDPECVRYLAWAYREGKGVSGDIPKAVELWTRGAALGDIGCISGLAWVYKEGFGVEQNLVKAVELWMKGVEVDDPECIRYLAWAFKDGQGINCHPETAFGLWNRGTDLGDNECARNLAWAYIEGFGVGKDVEKAASILGALVAVNDIKAILNLVFLCGNSVIVRPEGTVRDLLKKGAELGDVECMKGLAFQNRHGHDGPANEAEAVKWDTAAAEVTSEGCRQALIAGNEPELPPSQSS
jgi:TPR repeat protein